MKTVSAPDGAGDDDRGPALGRLEQAQGHAVAVVVVGAVGRGRRPGSTAPGRTSSGTLSKPCVSRTQPGPSTTSPVRKRVQRPAGT